MVVQNFDADDLLILNGGRLTDEGGLGVAFYAAAPIVFTSELLALGALTPTTINEVVAYQNGQDSYLLVENGAGTISTTVKFEDTILTDYNQIIV